MHFRGGVKPCLISVCEHELRFVKPFRFCKKICESVIPNGICLQRISSEQQRNRNNKIFTFLAFGGRNAPKRTDYLILASKLLSQEGINHNVIIIGTSTVENELKGLCGDIPSNVKIIPPREDVNSIYALGDCFVSTSVHETFSYAIAEAAYYGLPIIQSDIEGTKWSETFPSSFVFESRNIHALAETMKKILNISQQDLTYKCQQSSDIIASNYSLNAWTNNVINFFVSIP